jgi:hypothetical protein
MWMAEAVGGGGSGPLKRVGEDVCNEAVKRVRKKSPKKGHLDRSRVLHLPPVRTGGFPGEPVLDRCVRTLQDIDGVVALTTEVGLPRKILKARILQGKWEKIDDYYKACEIQRARIEVEKVKIQELFPESSTQVVGAKAATRKPSVARFQSPEELNVKIDRKAKRQLLNQSKNVRKRGVFCCGICSESMVDTIRIDWKHYPVSFCHQTCRDRVNPVISHVRVLLGKIFDEEEHSQRIFTKIIGGVEKEIVDETICDYLTVNGEARLKVIFDRCCKRAILDYLEIDT